ncbi:MAG: DUF998 domain-containing protein [Candidatus Nanoarchaeia archaeon]
MNKYQLYAVFGMLAPIISVVFIALLGWLRPDYSHINNMISELAAKGSPNMHIGIFTMVFTGILLLLFVKGLYLKIPKNKYTKGLVAAIAFFGILACMGSAVFPCELHGQEFDCPTKIHEIINGLALGALSLAPIMFIVGTKNAQAWKSLHKISYYIQIISLIALSLFIINPEEIIGLLQRIYLGIHFLWIELLAIRFYTIFKKT